MMVVSARLNCAGKAATSKQDNGERVNEEGDPGSEKNQRTIVKNGTKTNVLAFFWENDCFFFV